MQHLPKLFTLSSCLTLALLSSARGVTINGSNIIDDAQANYLSDLIAEEEQSFTRIFSSVNGDPLTGYDFHAAADGKGDTLTVIRLTDGTIFGGYNPVSWSSSDDYTYSALGAFLFNLTSNVVQYQTGFWALYQTFNYPNSGPTFGLSHDIFVEYSLNSGWVVQGTFGYSIPPYDYGGESILGGLDHVDFTIDTMEIFTVDSQQKPPVSVPDGGSSIAMLSLALAGVGAVRQKCNARR